ncbi:MAG: NYN domain-containing protein [Deltaproteobacteria bacterium]|nr:NYN domain-containing protein [Deltaproteobacteria bacterium]
MGLRLAIDGYNLLCAISGHNLGGSDFDDERELLIERLISYKKFKRARITIVFDGTHSGKLQRGKENHSGLQVIFSRGGELADDVLKEMAKDIGSGLTIVTSDRDVAHFAENQNAIVIPSNEFAYLLDESEYALAKGIEGDGELGDLEEEDEAPTFGKKKGPSRRTPKEERRKKARIKKL